MLLRRYDTNRFRRAIIRVLNALSVEAGSLQPPYLVLRRLSMITKVSAAMTMRPPITAKIGVMLDTPMKIQLTAPRTTKTDPTINKKCTKYRN